MFVGHAFYAQLKQSTILNRVNDKVNGSTYASYSSLRYPSVTGHASNQSRFTAWLGNIRVQNQVKMTTYSVVKDSRNHTSSWCNQVREPGPLTVTYNIQMLRFGWTIPISKYRTEMKTYLTIQSQSKNSKGTQVVGRLLNREWNTRLYNPMFQCQVGISASLLVQYPQINGRFVNTILAGPTTGKAVNPKRVCKTDGQL